MKQKKLFHLIIHQHKGVPYFPLKALEEKYTQKNAGINDIIEAVKH